MTVSAPYASVLPANGRASRRLVLIVAIACWLAAASPLAAQLRPLALQGGTLLTGDGKVIENGTVVLQGGKITAVGRDVDVSFLARKVSTCDKFVTPGLIDACSTLALRFAPSGNQATARALDAFDRYADDEFRSGLRAGVTAIYCPARCAMGIGGLGSVVRLRPRTSLDELVLSAEAALSAAVDADGRQGPLARLKAAEELRKRFRSAQEYRQAWEDYQEDLKEYEKKLAERVKQQGGTEQKPSPDKNARRKKGAPPAEGKETDKGDEKSKDGKKEKKEELKKPTEPAKDRNAEVLLRVLDGELRLRVEAHHPADILNLLEIAEEFNVALILEGASGAHLVADRLAQLDVPVVLTTPPTPVMYISGAARYQQPDAAAILCRAGVDVYFGTGVMPSPTATPNLALRASRAVGYGFDTEAALTAITSGAARLLGVEKEIGRLHSGLRADVAVWSDHPLAPAAQVERVFVGGVEVYNAERDDRGDDK